jgi:RNA polymerase sigma-70 factor (ECF subfamily)
LLALHRALPRFRGDASVRTWAIAIALRVARRVRHGASRRPPAVTDLEIAVFDTDLSGAAELAMLRRLLARLSPKKREAFVLMGILELTAEEAGRALGTSANTAASRYRHGRGELETYLLRDQAAAAAGEREALTSLAASAPPKKGES